MPNTVTLGVRAPAGLSGGHKHSVHNKADTKSVVNKGRLILTGGTYSLPPSCPTLYSLHPALCSVIHDRVVCLLPSGCAQLTGASGTAPTSTQNTSLHFSWLAPHFTPISAQTSPPAVVSPGHPSICLLPFFLSVLLFCSCLLPSTPPPLPGNRLIFCERICLLPSHRARSVLFAAVPPRTFKVSST